MKTRASGVSLINIPGHGFEPLRHCNKRWNDGLVGLFGDFSLPFDTFI